MSSWLVQGESCNFEPVKQPQSRRKRGRKRKKCNKNSKQSHFVLVDDTINDQASEKAKTAPSRIVKLNKTFKKKKNGIRKYPDAIDVVNKMEKEYAKKHKVRPRFHLKDNENKRSISCHICLMKFNDWQSLKYHVSVHKKQEQQKSIEIAIKNASAHNKFSIISFDADNDYNDNWNIINPEGDKYPLVTIDKFDPYLARNKNKNYPQNDYEFYKSVKNNKIKIAFDSYRNTSYSMKMFSLNKLLQKFKKEIGLNTTNTQIFAIKNYQIISNQQLIATKCIQCDQSFHAIRISEIGKGELHFLNETYTVPIYKIALLCSNFPYCEFPRARINWNKEWIKNAYYFNQQKHEKLFKLRYLKKVKETESGTNKTKRNRTAIDGEFEVELQEPNRKKQKLNNYKSASPSVSTSILSETESFTSKEREISINNTSSPVIDLTDNINLHLQSDNI